MAKSAKKTVSKAKKPAARKVARKPIDPISLQVIGGALHAIAEQMGNVLYRMSYSSIIRESQDWRKIRDPMGDEVWVNKSQLAAERTVITVDAGVIVREPKPRAAPLARFEAGAVVTLGTCGEEWCRVAAEGREGWVRRSLVWGADPLTAPPENR